MVKKFPESEKFRLTDQLLRTSKSPCANIAEGHGRYHYQENIQYCRIARSSLSETLTHLTDALDENYIKQDEFNQLLNQIQSCTV